MLQEISSALERNEQFTIDKRGNLHIEGAFTKAVRKIFGWESGWVRNVSRHCIRILDDMEMNKMEGSLASFEKVKATLSQFQGRTERALLLDLSTRIEGLRARIGTHAPENRYDELESKARAWKDKYDLYEKQPLTGAEKAKLQEMAEQYPEFTALLLMSNQRFQGDCFNWILRDNNSVEVLVKFPAMAKKLKTSFLAARTGRFAETSLKVENGDLTLPFEVQEGAEITSKRISILNKDTVVNFPGNYSLTMEKVFKVFKEKNDDVGNLEYFGERGITNFHVHKLGSWDARSNEYQIVDLEKNEWWKDLPVYEIISKDIVQKRYDLELNDDNWVAVARSSTQSLGLDIDRSHGYLEILVPQGEGKWRVYNFGKFAHHFPSTLIQKLLMISNTVPAKIAYVDENDFYAQRRQARAPFVISSEQGDQLMADIKEDIQKAREGRIIFQFGWENCAYWPQDKLKKLLGEECPEFFKAPAASATPEIQPLKTIWKWIRKANVKVQKIIFRALEVILLGNRGVVVDGEKKCVWNSEFHRTQHMLHPGQLHRHISDNKINGVVTFGNLNGASK